MLCGQTRCCWSYRRISVDVNSSFVVSGSWREGEKGTSWAEREQRDAAAPYTRILKSCCGGTGDGAGSSRRGRNCFHLHAGSSPIPGAGTTDPLFTCHTHIPKWSHLAERDGGKTSHQNGSWERGRRIHHGHTLLEGQPGHVTCPAEWM